MSLSLPAAAFVRTISKNPNLGPASQRQPLQVDNNVQQSVQQLTNAIDSFYPGLDESQSDDAKNQPGRILFRNNQQDPGNQVHFGGNSNEGAFVHERVNGDVLVTFFSPDAIETYNSGPNGSGHTHIDRKDPSKSYSEKTDIPWGLGGGAAAAAPPEMPADKVQTTSNGVTYAILEEGIDQETADQGEGVLVHYTAWNAKGQKYDSSRDRDTGAVIGLGQGQVIPGWDEGMTGMKAGEKRLLQIPSHLAYGDRGAGPMIGPNEPLTMEVEMLATTGDLNKF